MDHDWPEILQKVLAAVGEYNPGSNDVTTSPKCDMDRASFVLNKLFRDTPVYAKFCEAVGKDAKSPLTQIVDDLGDAKAVKDKIKRTPPVEPTGDSGNTYSLEWSGGDGSCSSGCKEAFDTISQSPCANTGGERNLMAQSIELETGCGKYKVRINPPPGKADKVPSVKPSEITCKKYDENIYSRCIHDVKPNLVNDTIRAFANQLGSEKQKVVDKGLRDLTQVYRDGKGKKGITYVASIHWIKDCTFYEKMVVDNPISGKSGQGLGYGDIFWTLYDHCSKSNHGLGGFQDYGCLRYAFAPTSVKDTWGSPPHLENAFKDTDGRGDLNICDPKCVTPDTCPKKTEDKNGQKIEKGCDAKKLDKNRCLSI